MRNSNESTPGPYVYSPVFKAGLYVSKVIWISQKTLFILSLDQIIYGLSRFNKLDYIWYAMKRKSPKQLLSLSIFLFIFHIFFSQNKWSHRKDTFLLIMFIKMLLLTINFHNVYFLFYSFLIRKTVNACSTNINLQN